MRDRHWWPTTSSIIIRKNGCVWRNCTITRANTENIIWNQKRIWRWEPKGRQLARWQMMSNNSWDMQRELDHFLGEIRSIVCCLSDSTNSKNTIRWSKNIYFYWPMLIHKFKFCNLSPKNVNAWIFCETLSIQNNHLWISAEIVLFSYNTISNKWLFSRINTRPWKCKRLLLFIVLCVVDAKSIPLRAMNFVVLIFPSREGNERDFVFFSYVYVSEMWSWHRAFSCYGNIINFGWNYSQFVFE